MSGVDDENHGSVSGEESRLRVGVGGRDEFDDSAEMVGFRAHVYEVVYGGHQVPPLRHASFDDEY